MFETSQTTEKLDEALAKAQGDIDVAKKDKQNPHFRSRYADLTSVWEACREALKKHEINVTQWPIESNDGRVYLITRIAYKGEWMRAKFSVPVQKQDPQGYGSALTYIRRFTLTAALGIVADEDDDGNAASAVNRPPQSRGEHPQKTNAKNEAPASEAQVKKLFAMAKERFVGTDVLRGTLSGLYGVESTKDLKRWHMDELYERLEDPDCTEAKLMAAVAAKQKG